MTRRVHHLGDEWDVVSTGTSHGVGFGEALPPINRWGVVIRCVTNPSKGPFRAAISLENPIDVPEGEILDALDERLVMAQIDSSRYVWRPAEAIARDTDLDVDRVRSILEGADDVVVGGTNSQGLTLYTTREHLSKTAGDVMERIYQVQESS